MLGWCVQLLAASTQPAVRTLTPAGHSAAACAQVFSALDRAQRKLGFYHADLGMRNVMEHYPR